MIVDWAASCQGNCKCLGKKKRSPFGNVSSGTAHAVLVTKCLFFPVSQEPLPFLDCILYCFSLVVFLFFNPLCHCCVLLSSRGFDSEQIPDLSQDSYGCDICSASSPCKMNFRELPNPLLTVREVLSKYKAMKAFPSSLGLLARPVTYTYICTPFLVFILFKLGFFIEIQRVNL